MKQLPAGFYNTEDAFEHEGAKLVIGDPKGHGFALAEIHISGVRFIPSSDATRETNSLKWVAAGFVL